MPSNDTSAKETRQCRECGDEIGPQRGWTADERVVCDGCWFGELSGDERKAIAKRANEKQEERRAE